MLVYKAKDFGFLMKVGGKFLVLEKIQIFYTFGVVVLGGNIQFKEQSSFMVL